MKKACQKHSAFCILHSAFPPAFTLVELMLVMGVIVILVAMLFPVVIGTKEKTRKRQALTEAHTVALALQAYRMEFGKWPGQTQAVYDTTYFSNNYQVILPLIGQNPRRKVFLSIRLQSTNVSDGVTNVVGQTDNFTNMVDPWGVPYVICLNEDMSTNCLIDFTNHVYSNTLAIPPTVYAYSATNYSVANAEAAVASFAGRISASFATNTAGEYTNLFQVETWSEPQ